MMIKKLFNHILTFAHARWVRAVVMGLAAVMLWVVVTLMLSSPSSNIQPVAVLAPQSTAGAYLVGRSALAEQDLDIAADHIMHLYAVEHDADGLQQQAFALLLQTERYDDAVAVAHDILRTQPNHLLARIILMRQALLQDDRAAAYAHMQLKPLKGQKPTVDFLIHPLMLAWTAELNGDAAAVGQYFNIIGQNAALRSILTIQKAWLALYRGDAAGIKKYVDEALKDPSPLTLFNGLSIARILFHAQQAPAARMVMARMEREQPRLQHSLVFESWQEVWANDDVRTPSFMIAEVLTTIAHHLNFPNNMEQSLVYGLLSLSVRSDDDFTQLMVAESSANLRRTAATIRVLQGMRPNRPLNLTAKLMLASQLHQQERSREALAMMQRLLRRYPESIPVLMTTADLYRANEEYRLSIPLYSKVIRQLGTPTKDHWELFYYRGMAYERSQQWALAEKDLLLALDLNPDEPYLLNELAYGWVDRHMHVEKSLQLLQRAVELQPRDGHIVDSLGWAYYRQNRFAEALRYLEKAIELRPYDAVINDHLGDVYWRLGREREARFQWQRAMNFDTNNFLKDMPRKLRVGLLPLPVPAASQSN